MDFAGGGLVKFFQCGAKQMRLQMKVKELITMLQAFNEDQNVMVNVNGKEVDIVDVKDSADTNYPEEVIIQVAYNVG